MLTAPTPFQSAVTRNLLAFAVFFGTVSLSATGVSAVSIRTKLACASDYRAHCNSYKVGTAKLRQCMDANGSKLSKRCVNALVADGEISQTEVARRAASLR